MAGRCRPPSGSSCQRLWQLTLGAPAIKDGFLLERVRGFRELASRDAMVSHDTYQLDEEMSPIL